MTTPQTATAVSTKTSASTSTSRASTPKRRQKKSKTETTTTAPSLSSELLPSTSTSSTTPVPSTSKSTKPRSRKTATATVTATATAPTPVPEPEPVVKQEPVVEETTSSTTTTTTTSTTDTDELRVQLDEMLNVFDERLKADREFYRGLQRLRREYTKKVAILERKASGKRRRSPRPSDKPGAFDIPCNISPELASFMGLSDGATASRREIQLAIKNHINENQLSNSDDRRVFNVDAKLKAVLGEPQYTYVLSKKGNVLSEPVNGYSYMNLQKYLKPHIFSIKND